MKNFNLSQVNVLIVEHQMFTRQLMRDVLHALGIVNVTASYADDLFDATDLDFSPDMIFTDWSPSMDGVDLIKSIRRNQANLDRFVPVVVVSAYTDLEHVCQARDAGMTEYLARPVSGEMIYRRICALVEHPRNFIETKMFFGPDRRRRVMDFGHDEMRNGAPVMMPVPERVSERALH
ncbi:MAG: response regulator [Rhodospirillaceae bacterium]|nr:response regulator [Rhodospirillaceae bacterium]